MGGMMSDPKQVECREGMRVICELPPGTSVKALDGVLIACHPDHAPIMIGAEGIKTIKPDHSSSQALIWMGRYWGNP